MAGYYNSEQRPVDAALGDQEKGETRIVHNQPYDESLEISDGEEITSTNATPREHTEQNSPGGYRYNLAQQQQQQEDQKYPASSIQRPSGPTGVGMASDSDLARRAELGFVEDEEESPDEQSESEESEEIEDGPQIPLSGAYDPAEFEHLQVNTELKELFQHIRRYTPQTMELETKLKPFIPEYIPAIGDIDAFLKISRPDGKSETLGLNVLDEPRAKQSDPTVLDLQLRTLTKQTTSKPMTVHSIRNPERQTKEVDSWIDNISELHRQKPATNVHYTKNMPDIENLMQEWPPGFEDVLREVNLPSADLDCDLAQYVDIICALLDIPIYKSRIQSLHVLFSLYTEFKNSQHFKSLQAEEPLADHVRSDSLIPEI